MPYVPDESDMEEYRREAAMEKYLQPCPGCGQEIYVYEDSPDLEEHNWGGECPLAEQDEDEDEEEDDAPCPCGVSHTRGEHGYDPDND